MNRIFTLAVALLLQCAAVLAQGTSALQFVDAEGNVIADGSTVVFNKVEANDFGQEFIKIPLFLKNTSEANVRAGIEVDLTKMSSGSFQVCMGDLCIPMLRPEVSSSSKAVLTPGQANDLQTEWFTDADKLTWNLRLTAKIYSSGRTPTVLAEGSTITVTLSNDPTGVQGLTADKGQTVVARYNTQGQSISRTAKGINIVKYADGRVIKQIQR